MNLKKLNTEGRNSNTLDIDRLSTKEILVKINHEDQTVAIAIEKQINAIAKLVDKASECLKKGGRIIYFGAGTSGRLGVLDASECPPTFGVSAEMVQAIIAGGNSAMFKAKEGAEDSAELAVEALKEIKASSRDCLIGIAASGRTPFVLGGLAYGNEIGAVTGSICCVEQGEISKQATYPIEVVTGPEAVTGSTRMKAGTAQKLVLNMISTSVMIKLGKVYQNLMVDVQPTNEKLIIRALGIIQEALDCSEEEARFLFESSAHKVKLAIIMGITGKSRQEAIDLLSVNENISQTVHTLMEEK